mmetsp:Transcript_17418/g.45222  ORF Transcript_17418/g.45222 Transcript_17418/m.45222 type:complete len:355 (-) Transcript_17418:515-1579(-)
MPRLLPSLRPFLQALPEVEAPDRKIIYRERLLWTGVVMLIFLVCCNLPLYGVPVNKSPDPFYWMRVMLASNRGTLMELGIAPIVTSGITMQVLSGWGIITVQQSKDDRGLFSGAQKFFGIVLCFVQAFLYVVCGTYGPVSELGFALAFIIGLQLAVAGCVVIILDELMQKGYGIGSGISLFIAANACENVVWKSFAPVSIQTARGTEYEGAVIAFFHLLFTRSDKARALKEAFTRGNLPNLWNVIITVVVFGCIVFFQGWRVELPVGEIRQKLTTTSSTAKGLGSKTHLPLLRVLPLIATTSSRSSSRSTAVSRRRIRSNCSTPGTCPSSCTRPSFRTSRSLARCFTHASRPTC